VPRESFVAKPAARHSNIRLLPIDIGRMFAMLSGKTLTRPAWALLAALLVAACAGGPPPSQKRPAPVIIKPAAPPKPAPRPAASPQQNAAPAQLEPEIQQLWRAFPGRTGVAVLAIDDGWSIGKREAELFPQQSVSKLWVAMTVLDQVDKGKLRLDQMVRITRDDLAVFHQPIRERVLAQGEIQESVQSLLEQAITKSDNTANDSLLRTVGGSPAVRDFITRNALGKIRFGPGERALQSSIAGMGWQQDYAIGQRFVEARAKLPYDHRKAALDRYLADPVDGASPAAIAGALGQLSKGHLLSTASTRLLLGMLERTSSGPNRLKSGVPPDWRFGHKTGTGQQLEAVSTGYNDVGIMYAPDGKRYAVVVMMGDTTASIPQRMQMMQGVSRAVANAHRQ
jgi:beta-lactamase class A